MKKKDSIFLKHILDAMSLIQNYLKNIEYNEFTKNRMLQDAVVREFEIIGEATKNLSIEFREKYNNIPWKRMAGMRDKLIHSYFGVDIDAVWETAVREIPNLQKEITIISKDIQNS